MAIEGNNLTENQVRDIINGKNVVASLKERLYANQQVYYDVITESSRVANSCPFIDFMLNEILNAMKVHKIENICDVGINERNILAIIANSPNATVKDIVDALGLSLRQCERLIAEMKRKNIIKRTGSNKSGF